MAVGRIASSAASAVIRS